MPEAWRIVREKHAAAAFTGEGAAKTGGRWNSRGVALVYTSASESLAALETLVHLNPFVRFSYTIFRLEFKEAIIEALPLKNLPADWRVEPPSPSTKRIGDLWVQQARSAVLALPSILVRSERNYLINPAHPQFSQIKIGPPEKFGFDPRLLA